MGDGMLLQKVLAITALTVLSLADETARSFPRPAGSYYQGDGLGANLYLRLSPDGTFAFHWEGCIGTYDQQCERWSITDDVVRLTVLHKSTDGMPSSLPSPLRVVSWEPRIYLLADDGLLDFVNQINDGSEPRWAAHGQVYLRAEDWRQPVTGLPVVPEPVRRYLLAAPLRGTVTAATGPRSATVDIGSRHGVTTQYSLAPFRLCSSTPHLRPLGPQNDRAKVVHSPKSLALHLGHSGRRA